MDVIAYARAALERGEQARRERRSADALAAFAEAVDTLRGTRDDGLLAHALTRRAQIERDRRDLGAAETSQTEAVGLLRRLDDPGRLASALRHLGEILGEAGRAEQASPLMIEALALYRADRAATPLELANAVRSAAVHAERVGDREAARTLWSEARDLYVPLDGLFLELTGKAENPGVLEADRRLSGLSP
jgi:tetratricopeptide (TPR) repeat protein